MTDIHEGDSESDSERDESEKDDGSDMEHSPSENYQGLEMSEDEEEEVVNLTSVEEENAVMGEVSEDVSTDNSDGSGDEANKKQLSMPKRKNPQLKF